MLPIKPPEGYETPDGRPLPDGIICLDRHAIGVEPATDDTPAALYGVFAMYASQQACDDGKNPIGGSTGRFADLRVYARKVKIANQDLPGGPDQTLHLKAYSSRAAEIIEQVQELMHELFLEHPTIKKAGFTRAKE